MTALARCETSKLTTRAAHAKDADKIAPLQHRHFATIATIIKRADSVVPRDVRELIAIHFANELAATNEKFDRTRFLAACK